MKKNATKAKNMNNSYTHNIVNSVRSVNPEEYDIEAQNAQYVQPVRIDKIEAVLFAYENDVELHGVHFPKVKRYDSEKLPLGVLRLIMRKKVDALRHALLDRQFRSPQHLSMYHLLLTACEGYLLTKICQAYNIHVRFSQKYYSCEHLIAKINAESDLQTMLEGVFDDNGSISKKYIKEMTIYYHELMHQGLYSTKTCEKISNEILRATVELDDDVISEVCEEYPCLYTSHNVRYMLTVCKHGLKRANLIGIATCKQIFGK